MSEALSGRRAEIDGLRAVAIALVVGYHLAPHRLPGGFIGVDLFFVLSGFLITRVLAADTAPGRWRRFYELRLRRLAPALIVVLITTLWLGGRLLLEDAWRQLARHTLAATLFVANIAFWSESGYFDVNALQKPLLHLWSLGIEEQFYLFWPALLWWLLQRPTRALVTTVSFAVASFAACVSVAAAAPDAVFYLPWFRVWELLTGAVLAQLPAGASAAARSRAAHLACVAGGVLIVAGALTIDSRDPFPSWSAVGPVGGATLLLWGSGASAPTRRILSWRPLVGLGLVSYPLYLWHWPLLSLQAELVASPTFASKLQAAGLALVLSVATYFGLERPVRAEYRRRPRATVGALLLALSLPAIWSGWILSRPRSSTPAANSGMALVERALALDAALRAGFEWQPCAGRWGLAESLAPHCTASVAPAGSPTVLLWGDSTAESWAPLVRAVAAERNEAAVVLAVRGCPPLLNVRGPRFGGCGLADSAVKLEFIERLQPSRIVITARWGAYVNELSPESRAPPHFVSDSVDGAVDRETSRGAIDRQLPTTLRSLASIAPVVVIAAPPDLRVDLPRALVRNLDYRTPRDEHRTVQRPVADLLAAIVSADSRIAVLDPAIRLCAVDPCTGVVDGVVAYQDDNHLTAQGALLFRGELMRLFADLETRTRPEER